MTNVYDKPLAVCSMEPLTGWNRTGRCDYRARDGGKHLVCAQLTDEFFEFARERNNALPGLKAKDKWCICAGWYAKAAEAGNAPPIDLDATHKEALRWPAVAKAKELSKRS